LREVSRKKGKAEGFVERMEDDAEGLEMRGEVGAREELLEGVGDGKAKEMWEGEGEEGRKRDGLGVDHDSSEGLEGCGEGVEETNEVFRRLIVAREC
jgi:hypothetical protein